MEGDIPYPRVEWGTLFPSPLPILVLAGVEVGHPQGKKNLGPEAEKGSGTGDCVTPCPQ